MNNIRKMDSIEENNEFTKQEGLDEHGIDFQLLENILNSEDSDTISYKTHYELADEKLDSPSRIHFYSKSRGWIHANTIIDLNLSQNKVEKEFFWLHISSIDPIELKAISQLFKLHHLTIDCIKEAASMDKFQAFPNYNFLALKYMVLNGFQTNYKESNQVYHILFDNCIICLHQYTFYPSQSLMNNLKNSFSEGVVKVDTINLLLLEHYNLCIGQLIDTIEMEVDSIGRMVLIFHNKPEEDMLRRISTARNQVTQLIRLIQAKPQLLKSIAKHYSNQESLNLQQQFILLLENLNHFDKVLATSHTNYLSQMNMNTFLLDTSLNDRISKLTAITMVLVPLTVIGGIFGMNCYTPDRYGEDKENSTYYKFLIIACGCIIIACSILFVTKRYKML